MKLNVKQNQRFRCERGQALVEFALLVPVLLLLIFGAIEFGRVFHATHVITSAAREGARAAAVHKNNEEITIKVKDAASSLVDPENVKLKGNSAYESSEPEVNQAVFTIIDYDIGKREFGKVTIKIKTKIKIVVPIINSILGNEKVISSEAVMRLE